MIDGNLAAYLSLLKHEQRPLKYANLQKTKHTLLK